MPALACWSCGRPLEPVAGRDSPAAERRCPRCGAFLDEERRAPARRADRERAGEPAADQAPGAPDRDD